jgi:hypothetical protein
VLKNIKDTLLVKGQQACCMFEMKEVSVAYKILLVALNFIPGSYESIRMLKAFDEKAQIMD